MTKGQILFNTRNYQLLYYYRPNQENCTITAQFQRLAKDEIKITIFSIEINSHTTESQRIIEQMLENERQTQDLLYPHTT